MSNIDFTVLTVFRRISEALDSLSAEEIQRLSDPLYTLEIRAVRKRIREESASNMASEDADAVIKALTMLANRQEAQALLDSRFPTKKNLEAIARRLDIPIVRQDKVEELRDKIVEATVGARIRSQAIQGISAQSGGPLVDQSR